ncbi:sulfatase-like hydrolase/transferase [Paenibacillus sp. PL2-23]|uniref:sulfatase family protein n=1 Tax=Paenibacillus sp. PL2-23 TaxID=2100729 RepID=UPI0030FAD31D
MMTKQRKPNILVIYTDQQRYDTLGVNGNRKIRTPNLDRLAQQGTVFSNSFVTTPLCTPSRIALFTGKYAHSMQRFDNSSILPSNQMNFAVELRNAGYRTGLAGKDHCFGNQKDKAFDFVKEAHHTGFPFPSDDVEKQISKYRQPVMQMPFADDPFPLEENITGRVFSYGKDFITESTQQAGDDHPFFLWLSIPDPHPPYMVCEPYASMYNDVEINIPVYPDEEMYNKPYKQQLVREWDAYGRDYPTPEKLRKLIRIYWGMISYIDDEIGKLMQFLEERGLAEDTIVVFTSDHGDYLGDHRYIRKGPHLYDSLIRVPLIIRGPGVKQGRTKAMVNNIDLFPTLMKLAGLELPEALHGLSYAELLTGDSKEHRDCIFMEYGMPGKPLQPGSLTNAQYEALKADRHHHLCPEIIQGLTKGIRTDRWKLCVNPGDTDELYDLEADPGELYNLAKDPNYADVRTELRSRLVDWLIETQYT